MRVSAHESLVQSLRDLALGQSWEGGKFLTERQVAERFQVSRITANKALAALVGEGLLEFRRGIGTFLQPQPSSVSSFQALADSLGIALETVPLALREATRTEVLEAAPKLGVKPNVHLLYAERLRQAGSAVLRVERIFLIKDCFPNLQKSDLSQSLVASWKGEPLEEYGLVLAAHALDPVEAARLGARSGEAGLSTSCFVRAGGRPLWWARAVHHPRAVTMKGGASGRLEWQIQLL